MGRIVLDGRWLVQVVRKDSAWPQRVVITGSASMIIPGVVGQSAEVAGKRWALSIEHQRDGAWLESAFIDSQVQAGQGGPTTKLIHSKDHYWHGDYDPNDLVLKLDYVPAVAGFRVTGSVHAVNGGLGPVRGGFADPQAEYLAAVVANAGDETFAYDAAVDISGSGRDALARRGVQVLAWSPQSERATGQETFGRAVGIPPLRPGQGMTVYFPVDGSSASRGTADVEFELRHVRGSAPAQRQVVPGVLIVPDPTPAPGRTETPGQQVAAGGAGVQVQVSAAGVATQQGTAMQAQLGVPMGRMMPAQPGRMMQTRRGTLARPVRPPSEGS
jgi:hypothetical protein